MRYHYDGAVRKYIEETTHVFSMIAERGAMALEVMPTAVGINEDTNAIPLLYRHSVALLDGFVSVVQLPSVETMRIIMRSFFEAKCNLEYIIADNMESRAIAYQTKHIMRLIKEYKQMDASTSAGKEFAAKWRKELPKVALSASNTKPPIENLEKQLKREPYLSMHAKLEKHKTRPWYSIDTGPKNFEQLCMELGYSVYYEICYRKWSNVTHATSAYIDSFTATAVKKKKEGHYHALRAMLGFETTVSLSIPMCIDFFMKVFRKLLPKHYRRFIVFYRNQLRPAWKAIERVNVKYVD